MSCRYLRLCEEEEKTYKAYKDEAVATAQKIDIRIEP
jgi:hypothetical protein